MIKLTSKLFIQANINQRNVRAVISKIRDPGIKHRMKILEDDELDMDEMEADFNQLHEAAEQHKEEIRRMKIVESYNIIKQKYFKEKYPNFLTWADKKQIQYLHNSNPEEWTIDKLSDAFPAVPEVVKKIIGAKWDKRNEKKIQIHDEAVIKNWKDFKSGKINLPANVQEHLNKFSSRDIVSMQINPTSTKKPLRILNQGEFSNIITSYNKMKHTTLENVSEEAKIATSNDGYTKLHESTSKVRSRIKKKDVLFTCDEIMLKQNVSQSTEFAGNDLTINNVSKEDKIPVKSEDINIKMTKYQEVPNKVNGYVNHVVSTSINYPEKIGIPKNLVKKGSTYKLNDCYYDWDGTFLYRVPGMQ